MRLFVALGPGDIVGAARSRLAGKAIPETSLAFSEQLFALCETVKIPTLAISSNPRHDQLQDGILSIENRPKAKWGKAGVLFHIAAVAYAIYLAVRARRFEADLAIIDSGTTHYFALTAFRLLGVPVAVNLHNVLWPAGFPPRDRVQRIIRLLNGWFFRFVASGAVGVSPECERQVRNEAHDRIPFFQYRCQFSTDGFKQSSAYEDGPFHVVSAGRAEENKGTLDIAKIAERLNHQSRVPVIFHVCGDGGALPGLRSIVEASGLQNTVIAHGRIERNQLLEIYSNAHALIAATKSTFGEGMPQACAEAMLSGLPVVTSQVTNTFDVIGPATLRAETDNIDSYANAILSLITDYDMRERLRAACVPQSMQFLDRSQSYPAAVNRLICRLFPSHPTITNYDDLFFHNGKVLWPQQLVL